PAEDGVHLAARAIVAKAVLRPRAGEQRPYQISARGELCERAGSYICRSQTVPVFERFERSELRQLASIYRRIDARRLKCPAHWRPAAVVTRPRRAAHRTDVELIRSRRRAARGALSLSRTTEPARSGARAAARLRVRRHSADMPVTWVTRAEWRGRHICWNS